MAKPEDTSSTTAVTLEQLQEWIPESMSADTFRGVGRSDRRLSGIRWPPTEAQHRESAALLDDQPAFRCSWVWLRWHRRWQSSLLIERIDAVSAWENEGGR